MIGRLFRLVFGGLVLAFGSSLVGAAVAKRRYPSVGTDVDDEVAITAIMAPVEFESHATAFRGGSVLLWYGGGDMDLRGVRLDPGGAHLTIRAIFGGGRLIVPETWNVDLAMTSVFGGCTDLRPAFDRAPDAPHLIVDGFNIFGGIAIFSSKPEVDAMADALEDELEDARAEVENDESDVAADEA